MIISIFNAYFVPLLKDINHLALLQEWKLNLDDAEYERNIDDNKSKPSEEKKVMVMIVTCTGQQLKNIQFSGFLLLPLWNILRIF